MSNVTNSDLLELYKLVDSYLKELDAKNEDLEVQNVR